MSKIFKSVNASGSIFGLVLVFPPLLLLSGSPGESVLKSFGINQSMQLLPPHHHSKYRYKSEYKSRYKYIYKYTNYNYQAQDLFTPLCVDNFHEYECFYLTNIFGQNISTNIWKSFQCSEHFFVKGWIMRQTGLQSWGGWISNGYFGSTPEVHWLCNAAFRKTLWNTSRRGGGNKICHNQLYFRKTNLFLVFYRSYIILVVFVLKPSRVIVLYEKIFSVFN